MPEIHYDRHPDWVKEVGKLIFDQRAMGVPVEQSACRAVYWWAIAIESDELPTPVVEIVNRFVIRLTWRTHMARLTLDCRPGYFELRASECSRTVAGKFYQFDWIEGCRRAIAWAFPYLAAGHDPEDVEQEVSR